MGYRGHGIAERSPAGDSCSRDAPLSCATFGFDAFCQHNLCFDRSAENHNALLCKHSAIAIALLSAVGLEVRGAVSGFAGRGHTGSNLVGTIRLLRRQPGWRHGLQRERCGVAALLSRQGPESIPQQVAGTGAVLASLMSALVDLPLVARIGKDPRLTRRVAVALCVVAAAGVIGAVAEWFIAKELLQRG
jgi:hypothetical protein